MRSRPIRLREEGKSRNLASVIPHHCSVSFQSTQQEGQLEKAEKDAGVSLAMSMGAFTLEERIPLLLIHGIMHLFGYDHETEEDWLIMTREEDRLLSLFRKFGREEDRRPVRSKEEVPKKVLKKKAEKSRLEETK